MHRDVALSLVVILAGFCCAMAQLDQPGCVEEAEAGPCKARLLRWLFNATACDCQTFHYGGCGGNLNNYHTRTDCIMACVPI
ncbi:hypothetical protein ACOMHN_029925 [Nucella lapillus]